ncbi:CHRDL1 (predicted) [Pycnogonum litorale]
MFQSTRNVPGKRYLQIFGCFHLLLLFTGCQSSQSDDKCIFSGRSYGRGDVWYPKFTTEGNFCVRCSCLLAGKIDCVTKKCPDECDSGVKVDLECCKMCKEKQNDEKNDDNDGGDRLPTDRRRGKDREISCMHNSIIYKDGQSFTSNSTGLSAQRSDQCVQCVCKKGLVLCRLKTCPVAKCDTPVDVQGNCCPVCYDCVSGGKRHAHGSKWNPVIGPFGRMECVVCKCQYGRIGCQRLTCRPRHRLQCTKPTRLPGQCCHRCANTESRNGEKRSKSRKGADVTSRRPNNNNYITATQIYSAINKTLCLPSKQTTVVVFKSHASTDTSGYYQFAFQPASATPPDDVKSINIDVYSWTFADGQFGYFSTQHLSPSDFTILTNTFTFQVLGATQTKYIDKFVKRVKRLQKKCTNKCQRRMERLQRNLKLKPVVMRDVACHQHEIHLEIVH